MEQNTVLALEAPTPQKGQTHSNDSSTVVDELFECVWPFCGVGAWRVKATKHFLKSGWKLLPYMP